MNAFKNRRRSKDNDQICCFNPFWRNFLFILSSGTVFGHFFLYVLRFLNIFSIHVPIKKLEFKCDGSLNSIFCRFLQTFVYHKIWTLQRLFYKVKLFLYGLYCEYIFFNLCVHSDLKYTHLIKSSLKHLKYCKILNIWYLQCYLKNLQESMNWKMWNDLLDQHRTLSKNSKCCIHCRKLSMPCSYQHKHLRYNIFVEYFKQR